MKRVTVWALSFVLLTFSMVTGAYAQELQVGGQAVGIRMTTKGVMVAGFTPVQTADGECSPAQAAGICEGDFIIKIGEKEISSATELLNAVAAAQGKAVCVTVLRGDSARSCTVQPVKASDGRWMMGLWLRDGISGIGTLTFLNPETGMYGALGHSINDANTGTVYPVNEGNIMDAEIISINPGSSGTPGELNGSADPGVVLGNIEINCSAGIFGHACCEIDGRTMETGEAVTGKATILSNITGHEIGEYAIEIGRIYKDASAERFQITVTDAKLCALTGGIVQGMSGSPIIQNGKIVGAVTHVYVNDPTRGYGIGIEDMIRASSAAQKAA